MNKEQPPLLTGRPLLLPPSDTSHQSDTGLTQGFPTEDELDSSRVRQYLGQQGVEALAWYRPFHMEPSERWGITLLDMGVWYLARELAKAMGAAEDADEAALMMYRDHAVNFLYHHEMFHFKVELAATYVEQMQPEQCIFARYWQPNGDDAWFGSAVNSNPALRPPLEEALANAYALHQATADLSVDRKRRLKAAFKPFIQSQPDGYNHALKLPYGGKKWKEAMHELVDFLLNSTDRTSFDPRRLAVEHLLFDGPGLEDDWIVEHYASVVPSRILQSGFASGRFAKAAEPLDLGSFCMTSACEREYSKANGGVKHDLQKAIREWDDDEFALTKGSRRTKKVRGINSPRDVHEFRLKGNGESWRVYREWIEGEHCLLRMHKKDDKVQNATIAEIRKKKTKAHWNVAKHNPNCDK